MTIDPEKYDFSLIRITPDHPTARRLFLANLRKYQLPDDTRPAGAVWLGLTFDDRILCVVGYIGYPDRHVEITDLYAVPERMGVQAMYYVLEWAKTLVDAGKIPYMVATTMHRNRTQKIRMERVIGRHAEPYIDIFKYPNQFVAKGAAK